MGYYFAKELSSDEAYDFEDSFYEVEFLVSKEKYETVEDFEKNCEDFIHVHSEEWNTEDIRKDIAKQLGCQENEIKLLV